MRPLLIIASLSGFFAVMLGAMGSHILLPFMSEKGPGQFQMANIYHLIHSVALLGCALFYPYVTDSKRAAKYLNISAAFFIIGILFFSGCLYIIALYPGFPLHILIPVGGTGYMAGWLMLTLSGLFLKLP